MSGPKPGPRLGRVGTELERRLRASLAPSRLLVRDDSADHIGHAGHRPEGETHFHVEVASDGFAGRSRLERQRMVYAAVGDLMAGRIHALTIRALAPDEMAEATTPG